MKLKTDDIKKALKVLKTNVTNPTNLLEASAYIYIVDSNIYVYNGRVAMMYTLPNKQLFSEKESIIALPLVEFSKLLSKIKTKEIDIEVKDDLIIVIANRIKAEFIFNRRILTQVDLLFDGYDPDLILELPEDFRAGLHFCSFSCGKNDRTSKILIDSDCIVSTDTVRLSYYKLVEALKDRFLIPLDCVQEILKHPITEYYIRSNRIFFTTDDHDLFISFPVFNEAFYDYKKLIQQPFTDKTGIPLDSSLIHDVDLVSVLSEDDFKRDNVIIMSIDDGYISFFGEGKVGRIGSTIFEKSFKGISLTIEINPQFLQDVLKTSPIMKIKDDLAQFEKNNFIHIFPVTPIKEKLETSKRLFLKADEKVDGLNDDASEKYHDGIQNSDMEL